MSRKTPRTTLRTFRRYIFETGMAGKAPWEGANTGTLCLPKLLLAFAARCLTPDPIGLYPRGSRNIHPPC